MNPPEDHSQSWQRLAAAGHDLRQPLHALGLYLAVLARKMDDPELSPRLSAALDEVRDALDLVLDYAKLQAGSWRARPREFQIADLFAAARERLAVQARVRKVDLRFRGGRLRGRGDPDLLRRALIEFVGRAVRAAPGGRVLVGARCRGEEIRIEIHGPKNSASGRSDELANALGAGLATLAGGRFETAPGVAYVSIQRS